MRAMMWFFSVISVKVCPHPSIRDSSHNKSSQYLSMVWKCRSFLPFDNSRVTGHTFVPARIEDETQKSLPLEWCCKVKVVCQTILWNTSWITSTPYTCLIILSSLWPWFSIKKEKQQHKERRLTIRQLVIVTVPQSQGTKFWQKGNPKFYFFSKSFISQRANVLKKLN